MGVWFIHSQGPPREIYLDSRCGVTRKVHASLNTRGPQAMGPPSSPSVPG